MNWVHIVFVVLVGIGIIVVLLKRSQDRNELQVDTNAKNEESPVLEEMTYEQPPALTKEEIEKLPVLKGMTYEQLPAHAKEAINSGRYQELEVKMGPGDEFRYDFRTGEGDVVHQDGSQEACPRIDQDDVSRKNKT